MHDSCGIQPQGEFSYVIHCCVAKLRGCFTLTAPSRHSNNYRSSASCRQLHAILGAKVSERLNPIAERPPCLVLTEKGEVEEAAGLELPNSEGPHSPRLGGWVIGGLEKWRASSLPGHEETLLRRDVRFLLARAAPRTYVLLTRRAFC